MAVALAAIVPLAIAQIPPPAYRLKETEPSTGSNLRRNIVEVSTIPLNRTYAELTQEEKAFINRYYEKVEPGDEPPFPLQGLGPVYRAVSQAQAKLLARGKLMLIASIGADGNPTAVKAVGAPGPEMVKAAATIVMLTKFKPALCGGMPCKMDFPFSFEFTVN